MNGPTTTPAAIPQSPRGDPREILQVLGARFPQVLTGVSTFEKIPSDQRIQEAFSRLEIAPRKGWMRLGVTAKSYRHILPSHAHSYVGSRRLVAEDPPNTLESVLEHSIESAELYSLLFNRSRLLGAEILKYHDLVEGITGDFTPKDPISREEKQMLELAALELLTESRAAGSLYAQHVYNCVQIAEQGVPQQRDYQVLAESMQSRAAEVTEAGGLTPQRLAFAKMLQQAYAPPLLDLAQLYGQLKSVDVLQMLLRGLSIMRDQHYTGDLPTARRLMGEFFSSSQQRIPDHIPVARDVLRLLTAHFESGDTIPSRPRILQEIQEIVQNHNGKGNLPSSDISLGLHLDVL